MCQNSPRRIGRERPFSLDGLQYTGEWFYTSLTSRDQIIENWITTCGHCVWKTATQPRWIYLVWFWLLQIVSQDPERKKLRHRISHLLFGDIFDSLFIMLPFSDSIPECKKSLEFISVSHQSVSHLFSFNLFEWKIHTNE